MLYNFKKMILVAHESRCTFVLSEKKVNQFIQAKDKKLSRTLLSHLTRASFLVPKTLKSFNKPNHP